MSSEPASPLKSYWSPYLAGALLGVLSWFTFATVDQPIGVSSAFVQTVGLFEKSIAPEHVTANAYFQKTGLRIGWEWMLMLGILLGAWASSRLARGGKVEVVPELWQQRFGPSPARRYVGAFAGGLLVMFGARLAGGCTSGHGISGSLQLAASGWLFFSVLFAVGVATAFLIYGKENRHA